MVATSRVGEVHRRPGPVRPRVSTQRVRIRIDVPRARINIRQECSATSAGRHIPMAENRLGGGGEPLVGDGGWTP